MAVTFGAGGGGVCSTLIGSGAGSTGQAARFLASDPSQHSIILGGSTGQADAFFTKLPSQQVTFLGHKAWLSASESSQHATTGGTATGVGLQDFRANKPSNNKIRSGKSHFSHPHPIPPVAAAAGTAAAAAATGAATATGGAILRRQERPTSRPFSSLRIFMKDPFFSMRVKLSGLSLRRKTAANSELRLEIESKPSERIRTSPSSS